MIIFLLIIPVTLSICSVDIGRLYYVMVNTYSIHSTLFNTNLTFLSANEVVEANPLFTTLGVYSLKEYC